MRKRFFILSILLLAPVVNAQDPDYLLYILDSGAPTDASIDLTVRLDNLGELVSAYSYGVCHDPAVLQLDDATEVGTDTADANGGNPPWFFSLNVYPAPVPGESAVAGWNMAAVIDLFGQFFFPPAIDYTLGVGTYTVLGSAGTSTVVETCNSVGDPPYNVVLELFGNIAIPTQIPAIISIVTCDSLPDCDGNGENDYCDIANGAGDCDGDGELDSCEIANGALDCDSDGVPDSCQVQEGEEDCDQNGVLDACDLANPDLDCDGNGLLDGCEIDPGSDQNGDGILDSCQDFIRGDCNAIGTIDLADAIFLLGYLFGSSGVVSCADACDINDDGAIDVADAISILSALFSGGEPPGQPFPFCGLDPTDDTLECEGFDSCA